MGRSIRKLIIKILNTHHRSILGAHKTEVVAALYFAKRRDKKHLISHQIHTKTRLLEQVDMPLTKGVVDLTHDGFQTTQRVVAIPKAHGLEGVAQHPRVAMQPNFTVSLNLLLIEQLLHPSQCAALLGPTTVAVVRIVKTQ